MVTISMCMTSFGERLIDNLRMENQLKMLKQISQEKEEITDLDSKYLSDVIDNIYQLGKEIELTEKSCGVKMGNGALLTFTVSSDLRRGDFDSAISNCEKARKEMRYNTKEVVPII